MLVRRESSSGLIGGAYRIVEPVGRGWAGVVYRAEHVMMGRMTSLKVVTSAGVASSDFIDRFREAAHLLSELSDPRIATIHDMGIEPPNRIYIAADLIEGKSLAAIIAESGPLPPQKVLDVVRAIIKGLQTAHALGVVHGSIKPSNIIISEEGPHIVDFAARRIISATGDEAFTTMTSFGPVYGEPAYLAPEQVKGAEVTAKTDVYGLGLLMYELLTGAKPFRMELPHLVAAAQVETPAEPPREFKPWLKVPKFIDVAVMRALSKDPGHRQGSAKDLHDELEGEIVPEKEPAAPGRPARAATRPAAGVPGRAKEPTKAPPRTEAKPVSPGEDEPKRAAAAAPDDAEAKAAAPGGPRLVLYERKKVRAVYPLAGETTLIGRAGECDIIIDDPSISRRHARVTIKQGRVTVEDLGSLNGTFINGDAVERGHVEHADRLSLGSVDLYFQDD